MKLLQHYSVKFHYLCRNKLVPVFITKYYNNITYFVLSITGILMAVCSNEGVDNLATNGTLITLQHIVNEDDMPLEILDFNKEHFARVKPYFTELFNKDKVIMNLV